MHYSLQFFKKEKCHEIMYILHTYRSMLDFQLILLIIHAVGDIHCH